jgi:hypothetical protein
VNNQLGLPDSAVGMLQHLKTHFPHIAIQSAWLEKLRRWNDAQVNPPYTIICIKPPLSTL